MKKSKILMPLTGIAAIGAIAPVAVMTACNKNKGEMNLIKSSKCGIIIDKASGLMTDRLGADSLYADPTTKQTPKATVTLAWGAELTRALGSDEEVHVTVAKDQGTLSSVFSTTEVRDDKVVVVGHGTTTVYTEGDSTTIKINADALKALKKEETYKFNAVYELFKNGVSQGKQTREYTLVACPEKLNVPQFAATPAFEGQQDATYQDKATFGGVTLDTASTVKLNVGVAGDVNLVNTDTAGTTKKLGITADATAKVAGSAICSALAGKLEDTGAIATATPVKFYKEGKVAGAITWTFTVATGETNPFTLGSWTLTLDVPAAGITVKGN